MGYSHKDHTQRVPQGMQQRHFEFVASILRTEVERGPMETSEHRMRVVRTIAADFADGFKRSNPNFNRDRFMAACGLSEG